MFTGIKNVNNEHRSWTRVSFLSYTGLKSTKSIKTAKNLCGLNAVYWLDTCDLIDLSGNDSTFGCFKEFHTCKVKCGHQSVNYWDSLDCDTQLVWYMMGLSRGNVWGVFERNVCWKSPKIFLGQVRFVKFSGVWRRMSGNFFEGGLCKKENMCTR